MPPSSSPTPVLTDGIHDLPPGKIAAVATYLQITDKPTRAPRPLPGRLEPIGHDVARYRRLYASVGAPWLWFSRAAMPDAELGAIVSHPDVDVRALVIDGRDLAIVELDYRQPGECELAFFGLVPQVAGRGLGRQLIADTVRRAFARPIRRLWLHTCTLDHPAAIPVYVGAGFTPYRRAVEIADDPRLTGAIPRGASPSFPVV